jgi:hypothetical protein
MWAKHRSVVGRGCHSPTRNPLTCARTSIPHRRHETRRGEVPRSSGGNASAVRERCSPRMRCVPVATSVTVVAGTAISRRKSVRLQGSFHNRHTQIQSAYYNGNVYTDQISWLNFNNRTAVYHFFSCTPSMKGSTLDGCTFTVLVDNATEYQIGAGDPCGP